MMEVGYDDLYVYTEFGGKNLKHTATYGHDE
jgi:hypothetical protein